MNNKKIMLIGGAGFIGHNLALHLKSLGADVCVVDGLEVNNVMSFSSDDVEAKNRDLYLKILFERQRLLREAGVSLFVQDARDYHALSKLVSKVEPQVVVQLAAVSHANKSNKDPFNTFDHSMRTLENALDASKNRVEHFIFFSSSMVYGHFKEPVVSETTLCEPLGIYGALKYGGEKLVIAYNQVLIFRIQLFAPLPFMAKGVLVEELVKSLSKMHLQLVRLPLAGMVQIVLISHTSETWYEASRRSLKMTKPRVKYLTSHMVLADH